MRFKHGSCITTSAVSYTHLDVYKRQGRELCKKTYMQLKPPEMERMVVDLSGGGLHAGSRLTFVMEEADT